MTRSLNSNALYASSGYLVFWQDGNLRAQGFDPERLAAPGEPRVIADFEARGSRRD